MKCTSCEAQLNSGMKAALRANSCPFCGSGIMDPKRAQQYNLLTRTLDNTQFTNKQEVDRKIKDKVTAVLLDNFEFTPLHTDQQQDDVVIVDDQGGPPSSPQTAQQSTQQFTSTTQTQASGAGSSTADPSQAQPRSLSGAASNSRNQRSSGGGGTIYHQAQEDIYAEVDDPAFTGEEDEISREEAMRYFQDSVPPELQERVQRSLKKARGQTEESDTGATSPEEPSGEGIRRLR